MRRSAPAFTLVELILVMGVLATVMALSAPSLSRSFRQRNLEQEATRFVALTEYARDEAVSQGVPMVIWIDLDGRRFGMMAKEGFSTADVRPKEYKLGSDARFAEGQGLSSQGAAQVIEFGPDGTPDPSSIAGVRLLDKFDSAVLVSQTRDGWAYEVVKETE